MLALVDTGDKIQVITSSTANLDVQVSGAKHTITGDVFAEFLDNTAITTATTTDIAGPPSAGDEWNIKSINIRNKHASTSNTVTVQHTDGTTVVELFKVTLFAGWVLLRNDIGTWFVYDAAGGVIMGAAAASDTIAGLIQIADQAAMEGAASVILAVTPGRQHFHPSAIKCWGKANGAGTSLLASFNVTSITDTATGRLGVTIATDFSGVNYSINACVERIGTALGEAAVEGFSIRNASQAAGTFEIESFDHTATTFVLQDPANYHWQCCGDHA